MLRPDTPFSKSAGPPGIGLFFLDQVQGGTEALVGIGVLAALAVNDAGDSIAACQGRAAHGAAGTPAGVLLLRSAATRRLEFGQRAVGLFPSDGVVGQDEQQVLVLGEVRQRFFGDGIVHLGDADGKTPGPGSGDWLGFGFVSGSGNGSRLKFG